MSHRDPIDGVPDCPFCGAAWTSAMLDTLRSHSNGTFCACCPPGSRRAAGPLSLPMQDLCCAACGRAIYRAPTPG